MSARSSKHSIIPKGLRRRSILLAILLALTCLLFVISRIVDIIPRLVVIQSADFLSSKLDNTTSRRQSTTRGHSLKPDKIAFINRHQGIHINKLTGDDFAFVAQKIGFTFTTLNPALMGQWGFSHTKADQINAFGLGDLFCKIFNTVVVADTIPDIRWLLQRIDSEPEENSTCTVKSIILITTNRFDYDIRDHQSWQDLILRMNARRDIRMFFIANNPWEPRYTAYHLKSDPGYRIIRPVGHSSLPKIPLYDKAERNKVVLLDHPQIRKFASIVLAQNISVGVLQHNYGGPTALAQFKAFVTLPYQVSTMKLYENLSHGVLTLVKTPRYLKELMSDEQAYNFPAIRETITIAGKDLYKYIEFYHEDLKDFFYTFDNPAELAEILTRPILDIDNKRSKTFAKWGAIRDKSIASWREVLDLTRGSLPI